MTVNNIVRVAWGVALVAGSMGGCECGEDVLVKTGGRIDRETIAEKDPQAPRPGVVFPKKALTDDTTLNEFITKALEVCHRGDYDGFRQLFGTAYRPPDQRSFERVWAGVRDITVASIRGPGRETPPEYYAHAVVRLRQPDRKDRQKRDVVVKVFREAGDWRLGEAPKEIVRKILIASSRPADDVSTPEEPP